MLNDISNRGETAKTVKISDNHLRTMIELLRQITDQYQEIQRDIQKVEPGPELGFGHNPLLGLARDILRYRRHRVTLFKRSMFGEPAWDMLLTLFVSSMDGPRPSVGQLGQMSGAPQTTALRWLDYLMMEKLVARVPNPTDRRSDFVELTENGRLAMERYLSAILASSQSPD